MHAPDNEISPCEAGKRAGNSYSVKYSLMERGSTLLHVSFTIKQLLEYSLQKQNHARYYPYSITCYMPTATGQRTTVTGTNRRKLLSQVTYRAGGVQFEGLSELARGYQELDRPVFKRLIPPSVVAKTNQLPIQKMLKCLPQASTQVLVIESDRNIVDCQ